LGWYTVWAEALVGVSWVDILCLEVRGSPFRGASESHYRTFHRERSSRSRITETDVFALLPTCDTGLQWTRENLPAAPLFVSILSLAMQKFLTRTGCPLLTSSICKKIIIALTPYPAPSLFIVNGVDPSVQPNAADPTPQPSSGVYCLLHLHISKRGARKLEEG